MTTQTKKKVKRNTKGEYIVRVNALTFTFGKCERSKRVNYIDSYDDCYPDDFNSIWDIYELIDGGITQCIEISDSDIIFIGKTSTNKSAPIYSSVDDYFKKQNNNLTNQLK